MSKFGLRSLVICACRQASSASVSAVCGPVSCLEYRPLFTGPWSRSGPELQCKLVPRSRPSGTAFFSTSRSSNVIKSDLPDFVIPEIPITEHVFKDFSRFGNRPALVDGLTGQQITFPELRDVIWRAASGLRRNGVKRNDVVMVMAENSVDYVIAAHAIFSVGGTITMGNPKNPTGDLQRQADDSEATFLMTSPKYVSKAIEISRHANSRIKKLFVFGESEVSGCVPFKILKSDDGSLYSGHEVTDPRSHVAVLPYSSGTTGLPKGVMVTHYKQVAAAMQSDNEYFLPVREGAVQLAVLPFYHIYAFIANLVLGLACGQTSVILPAFDHKLFLELIQKYRVNLIYAVPPMIHFLNKDPMAAAADLSSVVRMVSAAAPLGKDSIEEFHSKHKQCVLGQGYGLTETGPAVTLNPMKEAVNNPGSSGKLLSMTELKIVDSEDSSKELEVGEVGEICTRGPQMMLGYLKKPKDTSEMIDKDGWVHTGDIGYIDKEKNLYVCDRMKELIKYKGLQVPPAELEAILAVHPAVIDSCVIGVPDPEAGEIPKAFVVLRQDGSATAEEIQQFVADKVAAYKKLRGGVEFVKEIPRSAAGKIIRRILRERQK